MTLSIEPTPQGRLKVIIVGGGFGGLEAAKRLARADVDITLIDKENHHCFQPLLYQVATATLSPADVAWPIRMVLRGQGNARVLMAEVTGVDKAARTVATTGGTFGYDVLIIATGATHAYFGHDDWEPLAPGLKRIDDATEIRRRILTAFEQAELETDPAERARKLTFVIVGGGPTGVEMSGAIANVAREALPKDFRSFDPREAKVLLVEAGPRLLAHLPQNLSDYAARTLTGMGVTVRCGSPVTVIDAQGVQVGGERIEAATVIWGAGVKASPAAEWLDAMADRAGRVKVGPDLKVPGHPEIFVIGDTALVMQEGKPVPGTAPAAQQMAAYVAQMIKARISGKPAPGLFTFYPKGDLAAIGRRAAIVRLGGASLTGFAGWLFWCLLHIYFLITVRNRLAVAFTWAWDYVTFGRRARLITHVPGPSG